MAYYNEVRFSPAASLTISGANTAVFQPGEAIDVKRVILITTTAQATAVANVTIGVRDADGGNSSTHSIFTFPAVTVADDVHYYDLSARPDEDGDAVSGAPGIGGQKTFDATPTMLTVLPGQEVFITSDGGGDNGVVDVYFEYISRGFNPENLTNATEMLRSA